MPEAMPTLSPAQFQLVYNMLSLSIAAMLGSFAFFILAKNQLTPKYRPALIMSALVVGIAGYHYWRIFNSWEEAYMLKETAEGAMMYVWTEKPFNDAYRYVDWLLTVPLLVAELVAVLALSSKVRGPMMAKLIIASALMIALGYPGEIAAADDNVTRAIWGTLSTVPFCYILYVLWGELSKASERNSEKVQVLLRNTKLLLLFTWGFYPIAYMMPFFGIGGGAAEVGLQVGYSLADITAKCGYGIMIYHIARAKMESEEDAKVTAGAPAAAAA
ncbi:MAG: bacteriorhodopsin-like [Myxococcota bacterium]